MKKKIKTFIVKILKKYNSINYLSELKKQSNKIDIRPLSSSQKKEIIDYYKEKTGLTVSTKWHEYFYNRTNFFSVKYIPVDFYNNELIYRFNQFSMRHAYTDKNIYDLIFSEFKRPTTILKCVNGFFYKNNESISYKDAIIYCNNIKDVIIKPSLEGTWGKGVYFLSVEKGLTNVNNLNIRDLFNKYNGNFIIQEYIKQHPAISALNPSSVNTIRVITFRNEFEVIPIYHVLRIGQEGSKVDNVGFGGISVKIHKNGVLNDVGFGYDPNKKYLQAPSGIFLDGYMVPNFDKLITLAKEMHLKLPYFRIIGWDFAIDEFGEIIFIEWNRAPDLGQYFGPPFGEYTDEILDCYKDLVNTKKFSI